MEKIIKQWVGRKVIRGLIVSLILTWFLSTPLRAYSLDKAVEYLKSRQSAEGGFCEPNESPDERLTSWVLLAGTSNKEKAGSLLVEGTRAISFIVSRSSTLSDLDEIALCVVALSCAGVDVEDIEGRNMVSLIKSFGTTSGKLGKDLEDHCWGIIALSSSGKEVPGRYVEWLTEQQREDGGWGDRNGDLVISTSLAIEALVCSGFGDKSAIKRGLLFLRERIAEDGGFPGKDGKSNAISTAYAMRAIHAAGDDPSSEAWEFQGTGPVKYLESLQSNDGHFFYSQAKDYQPVAVTALSVIALEGKHLPLGVKSADVSLSGKVSGWKTLNEMGEIGALDYEENSSADSQYGLPSARTRTNQARRLFKGGAVVKTKTWINGFWYFIFAFMAYVILLSISVLIVKRIANRPLNRL